MYILIDKKQRKAYPGDDLGIVSSESEKSIHTLRSWIPKMVNNWFENTDFILIKENRLKGRRGGKNKGNEHLFNK